MALLHILSALARDFHDEEQRRAHDDETDHGIDEIADHDVADHDGGKIRGSGDHAEIADHYADTNFAFHGWGAASRGHALRS